jgi:kumamolisin
MILQLVQRRGQRVTVTLRRVVGGGSVVVALALAACTAPATSHDAVHRPQPARLATANPLAELLAASTDLGPSQSRRVDTLVTLRSQSRPNALYRWADPHQLAVQWRTGNSWATVTGTAAAMSAGFGVRIDDYRSRSGTDFYATGQNVAVPGALRGSVGQVGRILSYVPKLTRAGVNMRTDVPDGGLTAAQLLTVYNAKALADQGFTGKGKTIVFFEIDGFKQTDLDQFSRAVGLSSFRPTVDTDQPGEPGGETPMDLEVAHAIVPDAKLVVFDARLKNARSIADVSTQTATAYQAVDRKYPGAIWSLSLGLSCESLFTPADLAPMQDGVKQALAHGSSAFVSSGDTGGLECKSGADFGKPPTQADVGLNAYSGLPAMTVVGGTALSTDARGNWISEQAWTEPAVQQGTSGGPSTKFPRPSWQQGTGISSLPDNKFRMTPDVAADADPATGVKIYVDGKPQQGGGTSQAAPIWAGITVMLNQYLAANGGHVLGDINPLLYKAAASTPTAFHDITLGGNAVDSAQAHFDYTTGLGSPNVAVLAGALLKAQKGSS